MWMFLAEAASSSDLPGWVAPVGGAGSVGMSLGLLWYVLGKMWPETRKSFTDALAQQEAKHNEALAQQRADLLRHLDKFHTPHQGDSV